MTSNDFAANLYDIEVTFVTDRVANRPEFFRIARNFLVLSGKRRLTFKDSTMSGKSSRCYVCSVK